MAHLFTTRAPEARAALASEGLALGRFDSGQQDGGQPGQPAPETPEFSGETPASYRPTQGSPLPAPTEDASTSLREGEYHVHHNLEHNQREPVGCEAAGQCDWLQRPGKERVPQDPDSAARASGPHLSMDSNAFVAQLAQFLRWKNSRTRMTPSRRCSLCNRLTTKPAPCRWPWPRWASTQPTTRAR